MQRLRRKVKMAKNKPENEILNGELKLEIWPVEKLKPYAKNPRKNEAVVDKMVASIEEFGFRIPIVAKSNGSVVDGHLRLKAALKLGMKEVPVALADELTEEQVKAFRILANRSANWAEWEVPLLAEELQDLSQSNFDLELTGLNPVEIDDVINFADTNFSEQKSAWIDKDGMGRNQVRVKVCLSPEVVEKLEAAIAKTELQNRADAVKEICEAYLEKG